jgi:hypothetical protein
MTLTFADKAYIRNQVIKGEDNEKIVWAFLEEKEEDVSNGEVKEAVRNMIAEVEEELQNR